MTTQELILKLQNFSPDTLVMIEDNAGYPREINFGPIKTTITAAWAEDCADCEEIVGETACLIGYGCY